MDAGGVRVKKDRVKARHLCIPGICIGSRQGQNAAQLFENMLCMHNRFGFGLNFGLGVEAWPRASAYNYSRIWAWE